MFHAILGNEPIQAFLEKALLENRLPQTLLFQGLEGIGKSLFATKIAARLLQKERSSDLHLLAPEGKSGLYAIDTLREMIDQAHAAAFEGIGKVFILEDIERMQPASANALLKTLEEPPSDTTFILLSTQIQEVLPTIVSRASVFHFQPLTEAQISSILQAKGFPIRFAKLAHGSAARALEMAQNPEFEEQRKILFALLAKKSSYPELAIQLAKLETALEKEGEEDPVRMSRRVESLFTSILMWHRDQHARKMGVKEELLFFPDEPFVEPIDLQKVQKAIDEARLGFARNLKLSSCFLRALRDHHTIH